MGRMTARGPSYLVLSAHALALRFLVSEAKPTGQSRAKQRKSRAEQGFFICSAHLSLSRRSSVPSPSPIDREAMADQQEALAVALRMAEQRVRLHLQRSMGVRVLDSISSSFSSSSPPPPPRFKGFLLPPPVPVRVSAGAHASILSPSKAKDPTFTSGIARIYGFDNLFRLFIYTPAPR